MEIPIKMDDLGNTTIFEKMGYNPNISYLYVITHLLTIY